MADSQGRMTHRLRMNHRADSQGRLTGQIDSQGRMTHRADSHRSLTGQSHRAVSQASLTGYCNAEGDSQGRLGQKAFMLARKLKVLLSIPVAHDAVGRYQDALFLLDNEACVALRACISCVGEGEGGMTN
eukprot:353976-Chlamydomonas_euryale.AAC.3